MQPIRDPVSRVDQLDKEGVAQGGWRSATDLRGANVDDALIDYAEASIEADERVGGDPRVMYVLAPTTIEFPYQT